MDIKKKNHIFKKKLLITIKFERLYAKYVRILDKSSEIFGVDVIDLRNTLLLKS